MLVEGEPLIVEQPDRKKPWGLGCVVCARYSAHLSGSTAPDNGAEQPRGEGSIHSSRWATFSVGRLPAKTLILEDLLKHIGRSTGKKQPCQFHQKAMEHFKKVRGVDPDDEPLMQPTIGLGERDDVPTLCHMRICYDVIKRVTPPLGKTYEVECTRAHEGGDATASVRRGGKHTAVKIAQCAAAALFEQDRQLVRQGKIVAIGLAQDARKGLELTKLRFVTKNFDVHTRMCGLLFTPHKKAVEKVESLEKLVDQFCDTPELKASLADKVIVSTADGEAAEQLGLRLAKERLFHNQAAVLRCGLHMTQRTLETAVNSDETSKKLLHELITKTSGADRSDVGSFARAVRNSERLKADLGSSIAKELAEVAELFQDTLPPVAKTETKKSVMPSSAPQRFDSMLVCLQRFVWTAPGCLRFLCQESVAKSATSRWAQDMLHFLLHRDGVAGPQNLLLLALLAEFVEVCSRFVRDQEAGKGSRFHIAKMAANLRTLEAELDDLFEIEQDGKPRLPLALDKRYKHGYVHIISTSLNLKTSSMLIAAGKVAWYNPGDDKTLQRWVLEELGSILNIKRCFLATLRSEIDHGVALALQPFDVKSWAAISGGDLRKTFQPLSVVLQVPLDDLCSQYTSAYPVALRLQQEIDDISTTWAQVLKNAGRRIAKLGALKKAVLLMLAAFPGSGEVENNFSIVQGMSSHRRAGVSVEVLQACAKIALDGPTTEEFVSFQNKTHTASLLCKMSQNFYYQMFGGRQYQMDLGEVGWGVELRFANSVPYGRVQSCVLDCFGFAKVSLAVLKRRHCFGLLQCWSVLRLSVLEYCFETRFCSVLFEFWSGFVWRESWEPCPLTARAHPSSPTPSPIPTCAHLTNPANPIYTAPAVHPSTQPNPASPILIHLAALRSRPRPHLGCPLTCSNQPDSPNSSHICQLHTTPLHPRYPIPSPRPTCDLQTRQPHLSQTTLRSCAAFHLNIALFSTCVWRSD